MNEQFRFKLLVLFLSGSITFFFSFFFQNLVQVYENTRFTLSLQGRINFLGDINNYCIFDISLYENAYILEIKSLLVSFQYFYYILHNSQKTRKITDF